MEIARSHNPVELRESKSAEESAKIWLGRKSPLARWARSTITCALMARSR
jgi:hypothetical protein